MRAIDMTGFTEPVPQSLSLDDGESDGLKPGG